jgi:ribosomal protein L40E
MVSLLLVGTGMLLEAAGAYVVLGYAVSQGFNTGPGGSIWVALATLLMLISLTVLFAAFSVRRGLFPRTAVLVLFLAAISLFMEGAGTLISPTAGPSVTISALTIAAGVILLAALFFSATESTWTLLTVAILGLVSVVLLMVRIGDLGGDFSQLGGSSLNSYLLSKPVSQPDAFAGVANFFVTIGILGTSALSFIAYLVAAIGLMFWAILRNLKLAPLAWVTALVGFLLYGVDMVWGSVAALAKAEQGPIDWTTAALPFASAIVLMVASFIVMASAFVGLIFYGDNLRMAITGAAAAAQEAPEAAKAGEKRVCPNCGIEITADSVYCKKCGTKLGSDWFSAGQAVTGKVCIKCGTENPSDHAYCKRCGTMLT